MATKKNQKNKNIFKQQKTHTKTFLHP